MRIRFTIAVLVVLIFSGSIFIPSCKKEGDGISNGPAALTFNAPANFPTPVYDFTTNPLTKQGFELGRKLFYDGRLSKDGNFPCASCHQDFAAFSTFDHNLSHGFDNQFTTRNAPGLFNLAWQKEFQWDGGVNHLDVQPLAPLTAPNEMAEDVNNVISKLKADQEYVNLFKAAFNSDEINSQLMLRALSQFMVMLVSSNSKYDQVKAGKASFDEYESSGYEVFKAKCASCHTEPLFTDLQYHNTGFSVDPYLKDYGRMRITQNKEDSLKFKTPSLRNVALTAPYMHDGRVVNLNRVLEHYNTGVIYSATLEPSLLYGIRLSAADKVDLISFLNTLTDTTFTKDKRFSQP